MNKIDYARIRKLTSKLSRETRSLGIPSPGMAVILHVKRGIEPFIPLSVKLGARKYANPVGLNPIVRQKRREKALKEFKERLAHISCSCSA